MNSSVYMDGLWVLGVILQGFLLFLHVLLQASMQKSRSGLKYHAKNSMLSSNGYNPVPL